MENVAKLGIGASVLLALLIVGSYYAAGGGNPTSEEVVEAFEDEGLEVGTYYNVEDEEGPKMVPRTFEEGTRFTIPSLEPEPFEPPERPDPPPPPEITDPNGNVTQLPVPEMPEMPDVPQSDVGGRVFAFENQEDLGVVQSYYAELGKASGMFYSHVFTEGNVLLQINGELPKAKAEEYEAVLKRVA